SYLHHSFAYILHNAKHPCQHPSKMGFSIFRDIATEPLDQIIARYDATPGTHAELAKYGLTARQAVVGGLVMMVIGLDRMSDTSGGKRREELMSNLVYGGWSWSGGLPADYPLIDSVDELDSVNDIGQLFEAA
ncbi:MAG: hypothetical protein ACRD6B_09525, partial [Bryobacteraceae bacterium]